MYQFLQLRNGPEDLAIANRNAHMFSISVNKCDITTGDYIFNPEPRTVDRGAPCFNVQQIVKMRRFLVLSVRSHHGQHYAAFLHVRVRHSGFAQHLRSGHFKVYVVVGVIDIHHLINMRIGNPYRMPENTVIHPSTHRSP